RGVGNLARHRALRLDLGEVAHAPQQAVGDAGRAARAPRDLERSLLRDLDLEQPGRAVYDLLKLGVGVELKARDDAETIAQGVGEHAGPRGRPHQGERRQIELHRPGRRPLADHDVDLVVLERGVKNLFDDRSEPVDLVDEEHVVRLEVGEERGEVAGALQDRTRSLAQVHAHLARDDVRERRLAQPRRTEEQHVVESFLPLPRGFDKDRKLAADLFLADVFGERFWPERALEGLLLGRDRGAGDEAVGFDGHALSYLRYNLRELPGRAGSG